MRVPAFEPRELANFYSIGPRKASVVAWSIHPMRRPTLSPNAPSKTPFLVTPDLRANASVKTEINLRGLIVPGHARAASILTPRTRLSLHVCPLA